MKVCISELLKTANKMKEKVEELRSIRREGSIYSYITGEDPLIPDINVIKITEEIAEIEHKIRYLRNLIAKLNSTTTIEKTGETLGSCIVRLGQAKNEISHLREFINRQPKIRRTTFKDQIEYTKINYNIDDIKDIYKKMQDLISDLQMEIDRCNLNTTVDVDEEFLKY